ncbi:uncharacterized protein LOC111342992 [Stylophora pistillata]|uniref:Uncharacterized protein n=1 Tax=Stylophora pistillata TaxID=50429 RepID=A0A2B4RGC2_STYPI|nr:uncharacterized protein LOC111342992 [Stylophora pistillata]PFX15859.1 hypothetical protein AWC38_SpisGene19900 [Stylophora pistillata]
MHHRIGIILSVLLLVQFVSLGFVEATPGKGCRPGSVMCNRNGKRQVKLGTQLTQRRLEAKDETFKTINDENQETQESQNNPYNRKCRPGAMYCKGRKRSFHTKKVEDSGNLFGRI